MLTINLPIESKYFPLILDFLKVMTIFPIYELLITNSVGGSLMSVFNSSLAEKVIFYILAYSVYHLIILQNLEIVFLDDTKST